MSLSLCVIPKNQQVLGFFVKSHRGEDLDASDLKQPAVKSKHEEIISVLTQSCLSQNPLVVP